VTKALQKKALRHLTLALKNDPQHLPSILSICELLISEKKFLEAENIICKALSFSDGCARLHYLLASLHFKQKKYNEAACSINEAISKSPRQSRFYKLAADICLALKENASASSFLEKLIDLDPNDGLAHFKLSQLLLDPHYFNRKKLLLEISIDLLPNDCNPIIELAYLLLKGDKVKPDGTAYKEPNYSQAEKLFKLAILKNNQNGIAHYNLAKLYLKLGKLNEAKRNFLLSYSLTNTKAQSAFQLGLIEKSLGNLTLAKKLLEESKLEKFKIGQCLAEISDIYIRKKDFKSADDFLLQAERELDAEEKENYKLSNLSSGLSDFTKARGFLLKAKQAKRFKSQTHIKRVQINQYINQKINLQKQLDEAVRLDPSNIDAFYEYGLFYLNNKNMDQAKKKFIQALNIQWEHKNSHFELAKIYFIECNSDEALTHIKTLLALDDKHNGAKTLYRKLMAC
jgi:tetratricopeptide (TPR) repeat protein